MMSATELQQGWDDHLSTKRGASHLSFVGIPPPRIVRRLRVMMRRTPAIWDRGSLLEGQCEVRRQPSRCINPRSSTRRTASLITAGGAPVFSRYQSAPGTSTTADGCAESVHHGHPDIQQDNVRIEVGDEFHGLSAIRRLATDKKICVGLERHTDEHSDVRLVIYNKHPDRPSSTLVTHRQPSALVYHLLTR